MVERLEQEKALAGIFALSLCLIASDLVETTSHFWSSHQMITGIVTGAVLALFAIAGLDRLTARRDARRWRPLALMILGRIERRQGDMEGTLSSRTLDYCQRRYGVNEIPDGRDYFELLPEALEDPETWEGEDEVPDLLADLDRQIESAQSDVETWAPILIADPGLLPITNLAIESYEIVRYARNVLEVLLAFSVINDAPLGAQPGYLQTFLLQVVRSRITVERIKDLIKDYRDG